MNAFCTQIFKEATVLVSFSIILNYFALKNQTTLAFNCNNQEKLQACKENTWKRGKTGLSRDRKNVFIKTNP